ncbi:hypothetical protein DL764_000855 [Monosporascus ibericus]|uniref:Apple domain-containing protein n=1 Tax=Monosporascus ibericus TaxID=155417 RepID=A0A4Q4TRW9_9PEZI|nr:hypothetical protein DL764_000855 [Monosporascus ibericus]
MASSDNHPGNVVANNNTVTPALGRPRQQGHRGLQSLDRVSPSPYPPSADSSATAASPTTTNNTYASHAPLYPSHSQQRQHQRQESSNNYNEKLAGIPVGSGVVTVEISSPGAAPPRPAQAQPPSAAFEFRGFDFFAKRDFNELREASRAYFNSLSNSGNNSGNNPAGGAPRSRTSFRNSFGLGGRQNSNNNSSNAATPGSLPSAWLGDETPPATPTREDDGTVIGGDGRAVAAAAGGGFGGASGVGGDVAAKEGGGRFPISAGGESPPGDPPQSPPELQQSPQNEPRIFGLRRKMLWLLLVLIGIVLLVVVIAVSVGVGLGNRDSRSAGSSSAVAGGSDPDSSGADPTTTTTTIGTDAPPETTAPSASPTNAHSSSTASPPTPTAADSPQMGGAKLDCPAANGTTYQVPGSIKRFLRVCGVDYRTGDGLGFATKVGQVETETMLDCMKNCAGTWGCEACGWGYLEGDGPGPLHTCFMKSNLLAGARREVEEGWSFALLL